MLIYIFRNPDRACYYFHEHAEDLLYSDCYFKLENITVQVFSRHEEGEGIINIFRSADVFRRETPFATPLRRDTACLHTCARANDLHDRNTRGKHRSVYLLRKCIEVFSLHTSSTSSICPLFSSTPWCEGTRYDDFTARNAAR